MLRAFAKHAVAYGARTYDHSRRGQHCGRQYRRAAARDEGPPQVVLPAVALIPNARQAASCCACTMASSACLEMSVALTIMASAARPSGAAAPNA